MDKRKLEILKTDTYAMLSLAEPGQGGSVITRLEMENIEAMREVRRRYNAHNELLAALEAIRNWSNSRDGSAEADEAALTEINGIAAATITKATNTH